MKSVVFLDIDGVLNDEAFLRAVFDQTIAPCRQLTDPKMIDERRVARLNRLVELSGAAVVISSSWRMEHPHPKMRALLEGKGFVGQVLGDTPRRFSPARASEIRIWLDEHRPDRFVVLDDIPMHQFGPRMVHVPNGLEDEHVQRAIEVLR